MFSALDASSSKCNSKGNDFSNDSRLFGCHLFAGSDSADLFASNKKGVGKDIIKMILDEINNPKSCKDKQGTLLSFILSLIVNSTKSAFKAFGKSSKRKNNSSRSAFTFLF